MRSQFRKAGIAFLLILCTTLAGLLIDRLGTTAIVMLYLMAVIATSYFLDFFAAILAAVAAFLAINFFFIEPRYTFEVANLDSWAALLGFLAVSIVVASLVRRLRNQTRQAETARQHAEFARELAERLSGLQEEDQVLDAGCRLIHQALQLPAAIAMPDADGEQFSLSRQYPAGAIQLDQRAARWCCRNGKALGPGSDNWPEAPVLMMPFGRLPGVFPVLLVATGNAGMEEGNTFLRGLLDQLAAAYQRVCNDRRAREAERRAREESIQSALLASVSHDMRTPLTAILGATTALLTQRSALSEQEQAKLLESVSAEARHLASTTENILALTRLESGGSHNVMLDWQSPEEIVGAVLSRYRGRVLPHELRSRVPPEVPLLEADAVLLAQALGNLIDNALAVHRGNEPIWVGVALEDNAVTLYVEDRGAGFPETFRVENIHKFQRLQHNAKGMGLGLSIVQAIAQLHHAALRIDRRAGGGSRVALIFPLKPVAET